MIDEERPDEPESTPDAESPAPDPPREPAAPDRPAPEPAASETPPAADARSEEVAPVADEPLAVDETPVVEEPAAVEEQPVADDSPVVDETPVVEEPAAVEEQPVADDSPVVDKTPVVEEPAAVEEQPAPARETPSGERAKPAIPGADLEVDIVPEGSDPLAREQALAEFEEDAFEPVPTPDETSPPAEAALPQATIDLASGARYIATGKRKTAVARVILKPGAGEYTINGKRLNDHFPRQTAQRNVRQPLETVGYESRMDVVAKLHGGGISAQAGALRHGIARALIEADPNLRTELKRRGFLTRDSRAKERRKAGLKKARKKPQFSKR